MEKILKKCIVIEKELRAKTQENELRSLDLDSLSEKLKEKQTILNALESELILREKNLIPTDRIIAREFECDRKMSEVKELERVCKLQSKNNTDVMTDEKSIILGKERALEQKLKILKDDRVSLELEKKTFKRKIIESVEGS